MRWLAACAAALALALAGCGDEEVEAPAGPSGGDVVTVTVRPEGDGGPVRRRTLECGGADAAACERLAKADLSPVDPQTACTQIYGGDATASVSGDVGGREIDAGFRLNNGCEIARWEALSWLLGDPPRG